MVKLQWHEFEKYPLNPSHLWSYMQVPRNEGQVAIGEHIAMVKANKDKPVEANKSA